MVGVYRRAINDRPYYIIDTLFDKWQFYRKNRCAFMITEQRLFRQSVLPTPFPAVRTPLFRFGNAWQL